MKTIYFSLSLCLCVHLGYSQEWSSIVTGNCSDQNEGVSTTLFHGNQYFTGVYKGDINIGFNSAQGLLYDDIFIGKSDLNGYTHWLVNLRGNQIDRSNHIEVINDEVYVTGTFSDSLFIGNDTLINNHQRAVFISTFDTLGNYIKTILPDAYNCEIRDFKEDGEGKIILTGDFYQHFNYGGFSMNVQAGLNTFLIKYDPYQDSVIWGVHTSGASSEGKKIAIDQDNNIFLAGLYNEGTVFIDTTLYTGNSNHNMYVAKFDSAGNKLWLETIEGVAEVHGYGITCDDSSNVFLLGEFEGVLEINGVQYQSGGYYDAILIKLNSQGAHVWSRSIGGMHSDEGYDIVLDENQDPILMVEAGDSVLYNSQYLTIDGWNEPMLIKVRNDNAELIWYKNLPSTTTSGLVNASSISIEGNYIAMIGINRSSVNILGNSFLSANSKDFYSVILEDSLTYHIGLNEVNSQPIVELYPNPATDHIRISSSSQINEIEVFNASGQPVRKYTVNDSVKTILTDGLTSGLYIMMLYTNWGVIPYKFYVL